MSIPLLQSLPNEKEKCTLLLLYHTTVLLNIKLFSHLIYMCIWYMLEICDYSCNIHNWIYYRKTHWNHFVGFFSGVFVWGILNTHIKKKKKKNTQKKDPITEFCGLVCLLVYFERGGGDYYYSVLFFLLGFIVPNSPAWDWKLFPPTNRRPLSPAPSLVTVAMRVKLRIRVVFVSEQQKTQS